MKYFFNIIIILFSIIFSACDNENYKDVEEDKITALFDVGIESIRNATSQEMDIVTKILSDYSVINNNVIKIEDFEGVEVVNYINMPGKTFMLNFSNERNYKDHSLIAIVGLKDEIISVIEYLKVENNDTYSVSLKDGAFEFLTVEISKENNTMLSYNFNTNPKGRVLASWVECMCVRC